MKNKLPIAVLFFVLLIPNVFALLIESVSVTTFESHVIIEWTTDKISNSSVEYGTSEELGMIIGKNDSVTEHLINVTDLSENIDYFFKVSSCTNESECNSSVVSNFMLLGENPEFNLSISLDSGLKDIVNTTRYEIEGITESDVLLRIYINRQENPEPVLITHPDGTSSYAIITDVTGIFEGVISLNSGLNNITIEGRKQERASSVNWLVYADVIKPRVSLDLLPEATKSEIIDLSGTVTEEALIEVLIDNNLVDSFNASGQFNRTNITLGTVNEGTEEFFNVTLRATDNAYNTDLSRTQTIKVDKKVPEIDFTTDLSLSSHSTIFKIEGTTEPYADVTVINIGNFSNIIQFRDESAAHLLQIDPTGMILGKERETEADSDGYFKIRVNLFEGLNTLYFNVSDSVGNSRIEYRYSTMIPGDVQWYISQVEGYPTNIYFEDMRQGFDATAFVVLDWVGGSDAPIKAEVTSAQLDDRRRGNNEIVSDISRLKSYYDKTNKRVYALLSVRIKSWGGSADALFKLLTESVPKVEFEKQLVAHFKLTISETYPNITIPAYKYDKVAYAIQKPEELAKWIPPEMINDTLKNFVNPAIKFFEKAKEYTLYLTGGMLVACGAAIATNYLAPIFSISEESSETTKKVMYWACDRVLCPDVPPDCGDIAFENISDTVHSFKEGNNQIDLIYRDYNSLSQEENKMYRCPKGTKTLILIDEFTKSEFFPLKSIITTTPINREYHCVNETIGQLKKLGKPDAKAYLMCYDPELPQFDKSKCLGQKSGKSINPRAGIFSSFRCGCTPAMYGYSHNALRVFDGLKKCMEGAMIGEVSQGFCERMLLIYGCDIATDLFKYVFGELIPYGGVGPFKGFANYRENSETLKESLVNRYGPSIHETMGLTPEKIVNDACLFAFTGDIQLFEGVLEQFVTRTPVAPYGLVYASSRQAGYDPFVGKMRVIYNIYVGIVPGGPTEVELKLVCDRGKDGGEYCPARKEERIITQNIPRFLTRDDLIDINIIYEANPERYWFNRVILTLKYSLGDKSDIKKIEQPVRRHGDLAYGCTFSIPYGITCKPISIDEFGIVELIPRRGGLVGTHVSPSDTTQYTYYPDNKVALLTKIHNNYDTEFFLNMRLVEPNGRNSTSQYKIEPSTIPTGETQYYNLLVGKLGAGVEGEITYSGSKTLDPSIIPDNNIIYLKTNTQNPQSVKNGEKYCEAVSSRAEKPKNCILDSTTLEVSGALQPLIIHIYNDSEGENIIGTINVTTKVTIQAYASGNYRLIVDVLKDENGDGRGDTQIPFDTNSQELQFSFRAENEKPEHCNRKALIDILEPAGDFLPVNLKPEEKINIGANVVDDCNQIEYIKVSVEDEHSNKQCECTIGSEDQPFSELSRDAINCQRGTQESCLLNFDKDKFPNEGGVLEGGDPPYYRFTLEPKNMAMSKGNIYNIRYTVKDYRKEGIQGEVSEIIKTVEVGNVTIEEISLAYSYVNIEKGLSIPQTP